MKYALIHAPVLALPTFGEPFEVICNASIVGIGAIMLEHRQLIAFESRKFSLAEKNYTIGEAELTTVVHALHTWCCYLEGADCMIVTNPTLI